MTIPFGWYPCEEDQSVKQHSISNNSTEHLDDAPELTEADSIRAMYKVAWQTVNKADWQQSARTSLRKQRISELAALATRPDDIDLSDMPETQASDWHGATRGQFYRLIKQVTVRIDADEQQGQDHQTRLNKILRQAMQKSVRPH